MGPSTSKTTRRGGTDQSGWCLSDVDDVIVVDEGRLQRSFGHSVVLVVG